MKPRSILTGLFGCLAVPLLLVPGCDTPLGDSGASAPTSSQRWNLPTANVLGVVRRVTGGGHYLLAGQFDVEFAVSAVIGADGTVAGSFHQSFVADGLLIEVYGAVTCMTVDAVNDRAWIGGVVTQNNSTDPDFQTPIHQPGRDVWFRVLDTGNNAVPPDRTTFLGFEGAAGFITSQQYCEGMPWPEGNARTHPVTSGNIVVTP